MSTASSIKGKQLPAHSVSIEIYGGIARFPRDSTTFLVEELGEGRNLKAYNCVARVGLPIHFFRYFYRMT